MRAVARVDGGEGTKSPVGLVHRRFHDLVIDGYVGEGGQQVPGVGGY
jgi:hypothetical protein